MKWSIGCSGFHYKEWKGIFYPEKLAQRLWFEYYSKRFNTLELNVTFYRFPQLSFLQNWYDKSPADFLFSVKAPRLITHYKQFNGSKQLLEDFYSTIQKGLNDKLGAVLFQMPPQLKYSDEKLKLILDSMDPSFTNVMEFRNKEWWTKEVKNELGNKSVIFCGISYPGLPQEAVVNNEIAYYRFHGIPKLYYSAHKKKEIKSVADTFRKNKNLKQVYVYFNNTAGPAAIQNAGYLESVVDSLPPVSLSRLA
jgi:uncharacterized protein YecE (DUF72 family)